MHKLESLEAWKLGRRLASRIYGLTIREPLRRHFTLAGQIQRAALSVPANVVEGYALGTRPQLIRCLRIAYAEAKELKLHLGVANDHDLLPKDCSTEVIRDSDRLAGLLAGLLKRLGAQVPRKAGERGKGNGER